MLVVSIVISLRHIINMILPASFVNISGKRQMAGRVCPENIDENYLSSFMYSKGIPDPDLIIRPGREVRISNFLLWQCAYSEFYFTDKMWPEMDETEFVKAIKSYLDRNRRFGGI